MATLHQKEEEKGGAKANESEYGYRCFSGFEADKGKNPCPDLPVHCGTDKGGRYYGRKDWP